MSGLGARTAPAPAEGMTRPPDDPDAAPIPGKPGTGPLTPAEQRFADLLAREARAVAAGAEPGTRRAIAAARRTAGLSCHPAGLATGEPD